MIASLLSLSPFIVALAVWITWQVATWTERDRIAEGCRAAEAIQRGLAHLERLAREEAFVTYMSEELRNRARSTDEHEIRIADVDAGTVRRLRWTGAALNSWGGGVA